MSSERPAILLTGVGKRYDIVSCFARLTDTIAADPSPLAPAQYAAQVRTAVPRIEDPGYVPALAELCERHGVGAVLPLTDLDIEVLAQAREDGVLPAMVPSAAIARATYDKYEAHQLLERHGLPSPPTVLPGEDLDALAYPVMVKPRRGSGATVDPSRARSAPGAVLRRVRARAGDGAARDAGPGDLDRLPRRPRRPLPERDPAHDDRVARRRVDQGTGDRRRGDDRARPPRRGGARDPRSGDDPGVPRPRRRPRHHRREHALRGRLPRTGVRGASRPYLPRADRARWRPASRSSPTSASSAPG